MQASFIFFFFTSGALVGVFSADYLLGSFLGDLFDSVTRPGDSFTSDPALSIFVGVINSIFGPRFLDNYSGLSSGL